MKKFHELLTLVTNQIVEIMSEDHFAKKLQSIFLSNNIFTYQIRDILEDL